MNTRVSAKKFHLYDGLDLIHGGGVRMPVQIRSPRQLGKYRVLVPALGDCPFRMVKIRTEHQTSQDQIDRLYRRARL